MVVVVGDPALVPPPTTGDVPVDPRGQLRIAALWVRPARRRCGDRLGHGLPHEPTLAGQAPEGRQAAADADHPHAAAPKPAIGEEPQQVPSAKEREVALVEIVDSISGDPKLTQPPLGSVDVTVTEHAIKFTVTDLSIDGSGDDLVGQPSEALRNKAKAEGGIAGEMASEAVQRRMDLDITALFASFNSSTGSNSGPLTQALWIDAVTQLNIDNIPTDRRAVAIHPKQWGGVMGSFDDASVFGPPGQEIINTGAVAKIYGTLVFETANVATATVSSSTVYAGAAMHPSAVAIATKRNGMPAFETERDASLRAVEVVATGVWGEAEYRGGATTSGRGGAGVYF